MLPLGKTESLKSILVAARRLLFDEVSKHLSLRLAEGLARRAETILNSHGECRLESGRRCLPMFDCGNRPARKLIFIWAIPRFMSRLAACVTKPLVTLFAWLSAVLGLVPIFAAIGTFEVPTAARRHVARRLLPSRPASCPATSATVLTAPSRPPDESACGASTCRLVALGFHERKNFQLVK